MMYQKGKEMTNPATLYHQSGQRERDYEAMSENDLLRLFVASTERLDMNIQTMAREFGQMSEKIGNLAQNQTDTKGHADRLTRLEQRMDDADAARKSIGENIRWLIGLVIVALIGVAGLFFKK